MNFFRAYRGSDGKLIFSLPAIRRSYIRSGWFFINLMAAFPSTTLLYFEGNANLYQSTDNPLENRTLRGYFILQVFKLLRLVRIKQLIITSQLIQSFWEKCNVGVTLTLKFVFLITLVSHWFACIWGMTAFIEAGSLGADLLTTKNWISYWYEHSYVEGGLNPIGWYNSIPRYFLCLFWAIQSITSIGYGNIVPVTLPEYVVANVLMLASGIFWAYIIGNLVDAVGTMGTINREYLARMDKANEMVRGFAVKDLPLELSGSIAAMKASKRVRRFITNQRDRATNKWLDGHNAPTLTEQYPTLEILSPELQRVCALHLLQPMIETVPYLSSRYLSPEEQADIAMKSVSLEFSNGEHFTRHIDLGRGILIFRTGLGYATRMNTNWRSFYLRKSCPDHPIDVNEVLLEDDFISERQLVYHFVGFTRVLFIPRSVVMEALEKNGSVWKRCARWRYFLGALAVTSVKYDALESA